MIITLQNNNKTKKINSKFDISNCLLAYLFGPIFFIIKFLYYGLPKYVGFVLLICFILQKIIESNDAIKLWMFMPINFIIYLFINKLIIKELIKKGYKILINNNKQEIEKDLKIVLNNDNSINQ